MTHIVQEIVRSAFSESGGAETVGKCHNFATSDGTWSSAFLFVAVVGWRQKQSIASCVEQD